MTLYVITLYVIYDVLYVIRSTRNNDALRNYSLQRRSTSNILCQMKKKWKKIVKYLTLYEERSMWNTDPLRRNQFVVYVK